MRLIEIITDKHWWYHPETDRILPIGGDANHALKILWEPELFGLDGDFVDQEWEETEDSYWIHQLAFDRGWVRLSNNHFDAAPTVTASSARAAQSGAKWFARNGILADRLKVEVTRHAGKGESDKISRYHDLSGSDLDAFLKYGRLPRP